jgi:hypothetical protein
MRMSFLLWLSLQDPATTKEAMQRVQLVVGSWKCTGENKESRTEAWIEKQDWSFKIEKDRFALQLIVTDGRILKEALLSYDLSTKLYRFQVTRADGKNLILEGNLDGNELALDEVVEKGTAQERMTFVLLRENRFLISLEKRGAGKSTFLPTYTVGCTKSGVPFLRGEPPKCVVTGGSGTIQVQHAGKTYYVC